MDTTAEQSLPPGRTTAEAIAKALRAEITSGRLVPGERLRQVELAKRLGVSTTPLREAFGILQHQGLVRMHPQRGATVFVPTVADLEEHYEIRSALETLAVEKAALAFRPADAQPLRAILDEMAVCTDASRYVELNHVFHMRMYGLARRPRLVKLIDDLRNASNAYLQIYASEVSPSSEVDHEHREILAACEANDPVAARSALQAHLRLTVTHVTDELNQRVDGTPTTSD
jgi:DNA-binding GntR family transcriptional regulator